MRPVYVPEYSLLFASVAVCQNSRRGSAASLLTFGLLSIMSSKVFRCLVELQLIRLISACETEKIGGLDAEASCKN